MDELIEKYYNEYNFPGVDKLYKLLKEDGHSIKKKDIESFLNKQEEVQIFKETKKVKSKLGHITSLQPNTIWQVDIFYLMKYHKENHEYKYILACMDVFTRKAYCIPMKQKDNDEVKLSLKLLFKEAGVPLVITSDNDATLLSNECQEILNKHNIIHDVVPKNDHPSLGIIDRFARTLKTILHKRFVKKSTTNWVDALPTIINQYNNSKHSGIDDIKPNEADKPENIYKIMELNLIKKQVKTNFKNPFQEGDNVRVEIPGLQKKSEGKYSDEIYTVVEVRGKRIKLNDGKVRKYNMLLKVLHVPEVKKPNVIKRAKQERKQEMELKTIDNKGEAPQREKRDTIRHNYGAMVGKRK
jgi:hypothetical protein